MEDKGTPVMHSTADLIELHAAANDDAALASVLESMDWRVGLSSLSELSDEECTRKPFSSGQSECVPCLFATLEHEETNGKAAMVTLEEFKSCFNNFSCDLFADLNWENVVVAGGAILKCLLPAGEYAGNGADIDLFLYGLGEKEAKKKLQEIIICLCQHLCKKKHVARNQILVGRTQTAITIIPPHPHRHIQIVSSVGRTPFDVVARFDVDCCCCLFDGEHVWMLPRALQALRTRVNVMNDIAMTPSSFVRLEKYGRRGFALAVPGFDRSRVDQSIFHESPFRLYGLAKLLVLEKRWQDEQQEQPAVDEPSRENKSSNSDEDSSQNELNSSDEEGNWSRYRYARELWPSGELWGPEEIDEHLRRRRWHYNHNLKQPRYFVWHLAQIDRVASAYAGTGKRKRDADALEDLLPKVLRGAVGNPHVILELQGPPNLHRSDFRRKAICCSWLNLFCADAYKRPCKDMSRGNAAAVLEDLFKHRSKMGRGSCKHHKQLLRTYKAHIAQKGISR